MELKGFLSELSGWFTKYTSGDPPMYISILSIFLFFLGNLSLLTTNSAECMETENKLEIEIAWFISLVTSKTVLLYELENRSISWKRIEWNKKHWNLDRIVLQLKATAIISSLVERDLNGIVVEPKRLFSYQRLNRNPMVSIFFCNGALLGQLHVELRHIIYWPDNLLTCILKILVQLFQQSLDMLC